MNGEDYESSRQLLGNFNNFFNQISEAFPARYAYEIYRDKALSAKNCHEAIELMKKSLNESKKLISDETLEKNMGNLWALKDARPYMQCKKDLGKFYRRSNQIDLAIKEYEDLLKLDLDDNLNIKYEIVPVYFSEKRFEDIYYITEKYSAEESLFMLYLKALYYFSQGDDINSKRTIKKALEANLYVAQYMLNIKVDMGLSNISNVEFIGMKFAEQRIRSWGQSGLAMHWLMNEYFCYCYKNEIDSLMRKDQVKENLRKRFEG